MKATNESKKVHAQLPTPALRETTLDEVAGCLAYKGKPKTIAQMDKAIEQEILRRHKSGRY